MSLNSWRGIELNKDNQISSYSGQYWSQRRKIQREKASSSQSDRLMNQLQIELIEFVLNFERQCFDAFTMNFLDGGCQRCHLKMQTCNDCIRELKCIQFGLFYSSCRISSLGNTTSWSLKKCILKMFLFIFFQFCHFLLLTNRVLELCSIHQTDAKFKSLVSQNHHGDNQS